MRIIICDVDNVLSEDAWRWDFINRGERDLWLRYHHYHSACGLDEAHNHHLVEAPKARVVLLTAMPERYAPLREAWLARNSIRYNLILYRRNDDHRDAVEVKLDMLNRMTRIGFDLTGVSAAYDDRPDVIAAYRKLELPAERVAIHEQLA